MNIAAALTPDLLKPEFRGKPHPLAGHCYVASEVIFHLNGGRAAGWTSHFISHEGAPHWFLRDPAGKVRDLTASQFKTAA